jgi:imidazolonepropionase
VSAVGCSTLVTCAFPRLPAHAPTEPEVIRDAVVAWEDDTITYAGPRAGWDGRVDEELAGRAIVPGFVDCHTHLPFLGWRDDEYEARLAGVSYRDLHDEGGITRSARMLAEASDEEVLEFCRPLVSEMLAHGTTTLELKSGYGLSVEAELRQGRLARRLAEEIPQSATVTLLACHAVPPGMKREAWVEIVCSDLIPAAAAEGLADAVDVYVEDIAFTISDLERVAGAAAEHGLPLRCHADQLGPSGAAEAAARLGARSADHLNHLEDAGVTALGGGGTVAVLLPTSTLMLRAKPPPVRALIEAGAPLGLATDCNPGTSPVLSMPEAIAVGCAIYGLAPLEALVAATANPAWILGLEDRVGSLEPGKRADFVILEGAEVRLVPYRPGHDPVVRTFVGGEPARVNRAPPV